jgi:monovalent cation/hydrogen antiporter
VIPVDRRLPDGKSIVAVSWAGMRGVVSLAAAQTLPLDTPFRPLLLTCTIAVIVGTLVVQGLTLPAVIRALRFPGDPARDRLREKGLAMREASTAIGDRVEQLIHAERIPKTQADRMRAWVRMREASQLSDGADRKTAAMLGDTPDDSLQAVVRWRHELVAAEREVFIRLRNAGDLSEEALRELEFRLDLEEALLDTRLDDATGHLEQLRVVRQDREDEPG